MNNKPIHIAVVDDHTLYRKGLVELIRSINTDFQVELEASNGQDFLNRLPNENNLKMAIIDIDMPEMDGFELAAIIKERFPKIHILVITMLTDERSLIRMIKTGIKGYLGKDVETDELEAAINTISKGRFYFNEALSSKMLQVIQSEDDEKYELNDREQQFIELSCSELTYKEIADKMCLSPKTIDGYRAALFERFEIKSRVGLALLAIKQGWVTI